MHSDGGSENKRQTLAQGAMTVLKTAVAVGSATWKKTEIKEYMQTEQQDENADDSAPRSVPIEIAGTVVSLRPRPSRSTFSSPRLSSSTSS